MSLSLPSRSTTLGLCTAFAGLFAFAPQARAVEPLDTFSAHISGYVTSFDTEIRADGEGRRGTDVDLHRDLGLGDDNLIANVGFTWRPWEKHEFAVSYYTQSADATRTINRDIEFDGTLYEASSRIRTDVDIDAYEASYTWWAATNDRWALGPRVGLIWYKMALGIDLDVDVGGNQGSASRRSRVSADVPAPMIGGGWRWTPADDWRLSADLGYFTVNVNDIDGNIYFGRAGVEWFPWERTGITLDYTYTRIEADADKKSFTGSVDFIDAGLRLGLVYRF